MTYPTRTSVRVVLSAAAVGAAALAVSAFGSSVVADSSEHASAVIVGVGGAPIGTARFVEDANGVVHVNVKVSGLSAGLHGVHIHESGSCASVTGPFSGAGVHYNPTGAVHGAHAGDLPNLIVNDDLQGRLNATTTGVSVGEGAATLFDSTPGAVGSAIVIHANQDDFGPVANGNSGGRVACGVITP